MKRRWAGEGILGVPECPRTNSQRRAPGAPGPPSGSRQESGRLRPEVHFKRGFRDCVPITSGPGRKRPAAPVVGPGSRRLLRRPTAPMAGDPFSPTESRHLGPCRSPAQRPDRDRGPGRVVQPIPITNTVVSRDPSPLQRGHPGLGRRPRGRAARRQVKRVSLDQPGTLGRGLRQEGRVCRDHPRPNPDKAGVRCFQNQPPKRLLGVHI